MLKETLQITFHHILPRTVKPTSKNIKRPYNNNHEKYAVSEMASVDHGISCSPIRRSVEEASSREKTGEAQSRPEEAASRMCPADS